MKSDIDFDRAFDAQAVAKLLMQLRAKRGWTEAEAAKKCRMSRNGYMAVELRRVKNPRQKTLQGISEAFGISYGELMDCSAITIPSIDIALLNEAEKKCREALDAIHALRSAYLKDFTSK